MAQESLHWADQYARKIIQERGDKEKYTIASGITPSGTVHIGNFRELITVELIGRALKNLGKDIRFIFSWDNYDPFRKVPKNMPEQDILKTFLRKAITDVPDTYDCKHKSFARHNECAVEEIIPKVGVQPEFLYQADKYKSCEYANQIKIALEKTEEIKGILNAYRKEPLADDWLPVSIFCEKCEKDIITTTTYDGDYNLSYTCKCGHSDTFSFKEKGIVKLKWRIDWPMRWLFEEVDFEPGGKDHFAASGSYETASKVSQSIFDYKEPYGFMYEWIGTKGGGQFSSSQGNVVTLQDVLDIYEPEMIRWMFAGSRPNAEFSISFDSDVIKMYEDWDRVERIYFNAEKVKNEKDLAQQKRIYELSQVENVPKKLPYQPSFRHLTTVLLMNHLDINSSIKFYEKQLKDEADKEKLKKRAICAKNWLEHHAPDDFKWSLQDKVPKIELNDNQKTALKQVAEILKKDHEWNDEELHAEFYVIVQNNNLETKEFFQAAYGVLIARSRGPKLAGFVLQVKEKAIELFSKV